MLAICIAAFNQLSGINAVLYYAPMIFRVAGASKEMALQLPMFIGLTNFVCTMIALFCIDGFGRKKLMYFGSLGYIISLAVVGIMFTVYSEQFNASIKYIEQQDAAVALVATPDGTGETTVQAPDIPKAGIYGVLIGLIVFSLTIL